MNDFRQRLQGVATGAGVDRELAPKALEAALQWNAALLRAAAGSDTADAERLQWLILLVNLAEALNSADPLLKLLKDAGLLDRLGVGATLEQTLASHTAAVETLRQQLNALRQNLADGDRQDAEITHLKNELDARQSEYNRQVQYLAARREDVQRRADEQERVRQEAAEIERLEQLTSHSEQLHEQAAQLTDRRNRVAATQDAEAALAAIAGELLSLELIRLAPLSETLTTRMSEISAAEHSLQQQVNALHAAERQLRDLQAKFAEASELQQRRVEPLRIYAEANARVAAQLLRPGDDPRAWLDQAKELLRRVDDALKTALQANEAAKRIEPLQYHG